jgi:hypothetical protein
LARVVRGGSWNNDADNARSSARNDNNPANTNDNLGFRVLCRSHIVIRSAKCDFLATWNCRNLANANKFGHIRRVNAMLGLFVPVLATPLELLGDNDE